MVKQTQASRIAKLEKELSALKGKTVDKAKHLTPRENFTRSKNWMESKGYKLVGDATDTTYTRKGGVTVPAVQAKFSNGVTYVATAYRFFRK